MNKKPNKIDIRFILLLVFIVLSVVLANIFSVDSEKIDIFFKQIPLGVSGLVFVFFYIIGTFFLFPLKDPLKIIGAVIFGAYLSTLHIF